MRILVLVSSLWLYTGITRPALASPRQNNAEVPIERPDSSIQLFIKGDALYIVRASSREISAQDIVVSNTPRLNKPRQNRILSSGDPLDNPAGVTVDAAGTIYVADPRARTVFAIRPDQKPEVLFAGRPLLHPTGIAINNNQLYICDPEAKSIFSINLLTHQIFEEFHRPISAFPEKIIWENGKLYAYSPFTGSVIRLFSERDGPKEILGQGTSVVWSLENSDPNGLKRGEIITFKEQWGNAIDFGVSREILYLLDATGRRISMLPLLGGQKVVFNLPTEFGQAIRFAVSDHRLCLLTSKGVVAMDTVVPATLDFDDESASTGLVSLYMYLIKNGLLPTREITVRQGDSIARIVSDVGILPSGYVESFQATVCVLNRPLCGNGNTAKALVVGTKINLPDLPITARPGRKIIDFPIKPDATGDPRLQKHLDGTLGEVGSEFAGANGSKDKLTKSLLSLNYWYQGKDILNERLGTFIIPAQSYEASVALPEEAVTRKGSPLYDLLSKNVRLNSPVLYYELTDQSYIKDDKQTDIMKPWGLQDSDPRCTKLASPDWSRVLEIIHYCLPIEERSSNIGIVEKLVDTTHPAFALATGQSSLQRYAATEDGSKTRPTDSDSQNKFNPDWDHGTHIAGLVGAHSHLHYVFGVQPESTIWGIKPGDFSKALEVDPNEKDLSEVHVFNISLGEKDLTDPQNRGIGIDAAGQLKALIDQNIYLDKLFVIAAGDVKQQVQEGSLATRSFRQNVIVVGASNLNDPPGFSEHSSYGWEYVDIVAPGDDIVSALYGGGYGKATGTSQATALVSGTAALLAGVEPNWEPWKIKQRILSSADLWTDGPNSANVRTGMLNVKAAVLNRTEAVLRFWAPSAPSDSRSIRPNGNTTVSVADCSGRIQYAGVKGALKVLIPGEGTKDIPLKNIRRFHRDPETKNFTILYTRDNRSDQTVKLENRIGLERLTNIEGINLRGVTQFVFTPSNGCEAKTTIDLKDLSELINGFY